MKTDYSKPFLRFWDCYPRKTAKGPAWKSWQKNVDESDAFMWKAIVADLEKRSRLKWWPFDTTKIPHAATWLSQQRYLDEGWEADIKTRGQDGAKASGYVPRAPIVLEPGHDKGPWMSMLNRLGRNYMIMAGGLSDALIIGLLKIKNDVFSEMVPIANEEIATSENPVKAKGEMAFIMAETMLIRFDMLSGRQLKEAIIDMAQKPS